MSPREPYQFSESERATFAATLAFLKERMTEQDTLNWALDLKETQEIERRAILSLIEHPTKKLPKLWRDAWRILEEAWSEDRGEKDEPRLHQNRKKSQ